MARPREFDEAEVLGKIVRRFWWRGYAATSVRDLEAASGIGIASLYNAFGGKRALFVAALERYSEHQTRACLREIERIPSPAARIRTFVGRVIEAALDDPDRMGCLVINTAIELGPRDPEIAGLVDAHLREVEAFFRRSLEAAVTAGEADPDLVPQDAARSFSALMFGLRVLARTRPDRASMEGAARPLLAMLDAGRQPPATSAIDLAMGKTG